MGGEERVATTVCSGVFFKSRTVSTSNPATATSSTAHSHTIVGALFKQSPAERRQAAFGSNDAGNAGTAEQASASGP